MPWVQWPPRQAHRYEWEKMKSWRLFVLLRVVLITTILSAPDSAPHISPGLPQDLTDLRGRAGQFKKGKCFKRWVEAHEGVRAEVTQPDDILVIHINCISLRAVTRQFPFPP